MPDDEQEEVALTGQARFDAAMKAIPVTGGPTVDELVEMAREAAENRVANGGEPSVFGELVVSLFSRDYNADVWKWFVRVEAEGAERGIEIFDNGSSTQYCCGFTFLGVRLPRLRRSALGVL